MGRALQDEERFAESLILGCEPQANLEGRTAPSFDSADDKSPADPLELARLRPKIFPKRRSSRLATAWTPGKRDPRTKEARDDPFDLGGALW
jgi:hypothetical protein